MVKPTREERKNGWDETSLEAYRVEREEEMTLSGTNFVGGNIVTEWEPPRKLPVIQNSLQHNPHRYWR